MLGLFDPPRASLWWIAALQVVVWIGCESNTPADGGRENAPDVGALADAPVIADAAVAHEPDAAPGLDAAAPPVRPDDPIISRSERDYADNEHGVVSIGRVSQWLEDWERNRPPYVDGELIVLQLEPTATGAPFVAGASGVRAYHAAELTRLTEQRNDGVLAVGVVPSNGVRIDTFMRRFRIRPNHDLVLLASGEPSPESLASLARAWLALRYWGFEHASLAILEAPVSALAASQRTELPPAHPHDGTTRIPTLPRAHFELLADLGTVRAAVSDGAPLVDARPREEFDGLRAGAAPADDSCLLRAPSCTAISSGRITGARSLPWRDLLTPEGRLRPHDELDAVLGPARGVEPITVYDSDGRGSALVAFALLSVVGRPARWYAASFLEWGSLNGSHPDAALRTLPDDSPWRTDSSTWTEAANFTSADAAIRPIVFDPHAASADLVQRTDGDYLARPPPLPAVGASGSGC
jgi:3-mercaptopyruvate sulfurtransferase SseA